MKHLFVPYKLAVMAKEKGFNEPCLAYYQGEGDLICCNTNAITGEFYPYSTQRDDDSATAPLYQQLIDWLSINHEIKVLESPSCGYKIWLKLNDKWFSDTWRDTLDAALTKAFELI